MQRGVKEVKKSVNLGDEGEVKFLSETKRVCSHGDRYVVIDG